MKLIERAIPRIPGADWAKGFVAPGTRLTVLLAKEVGRIHLSIAHPTRDPTWAEIGFVRDKLLDRAAWFVMVFPPPYHYVNTHPHCFHLWESRDAEGHDIWAEATAQKPTRGR